MAAARGGSTRPAKSPGKQHRPIKRGRWHPLTAIQRPWQAMPLRTRLTLMTTGLLAIGLIVVSFVVTSLLYSHMMGQIDSQLRSTARPVGQQFLDQLREGRIPSDIPSNYYVKAEFRDASRNGEWISADTAAKYGRPQIKGLDFQRALTHADTGNFDIITVNSDKPGRRWRMITALTQNPDTGEYTGAIGLALPLSDVMETVERTRLVVALADVLIISVGAIFATYLVHRSFRSLRQIEGVAARIAHGDLSARILVTEPRTTEVGSLQRAINTMLAQNESAFAAQVVAQERMTRFVSDASHELRTPLAAIRGYGELYRMGGVPAYKTGEVMGRIETESNRMGRLVDDLLQLARIDEGREMSMEPVNLTDLAAGALSDMMVLAPERDCGLVAGVEGDEAAVALGGQHHHVAEGSGGQVGEVDRLHRHLPALIDPSQLQQVVDEASHPVGLGLDAPHDLTGLVRGHPAHPVELAVAADRGQWRAQLMRGVGDEARHPFLGHDLGGEGGLILRQHRVDRPLQ